MNAKKIFSILLLSSPLAVKSQAAYNPRKLTVADVKSKENIQLNTLLSTVNMINTTKQLPPSQSVPLSHLPKGINLEAGPQDTIRYVMQGYTIDNTMLVFLECPVQAGVARGGGWTVPSLWVDMPGQTGWWWVVTLPTYNATLVQVLQAS